MTEVTKANSFNVSSRGETIVWKSVETRLTDPVMVELIHQAKLIFVERKIINTFDSLDLSVLRIYLNNFIEEMELQFPPKKGSKSKSKPFSFSSIPEEIPANIEKSKQKKNSKKKGLTAEEIRGKKAETDLLKSMTDFKNTLKIVNNMPIQNKKFIESFFTIVYWVFYLITKAKDVHNEIYFNACISLYRALNDSKSFLTNEMINETEALLAEIEKLYFSKIPVSRKFDSFLEYSRFTLESYWDTIKPTRIAFYEEQLEIMDYVLNNSDQSKLVFYQSPPANGKTLIATILAKLLSEQHGYRNHENKIVLYICYSPTVRDEVATSCYGIGVDVKYMLATTKPDPDNNGNPKTYLESHKSCYFEWKKKRYGKDKDLFDRAKIPDKKHEDLRRQWDWYMEATKPQSQQKWAEYMKRGEEDSIYTYNSMEANHAPQMIISDLDSAYALLNHPDFKGKFVTFFDEAFATSSLDITAKILSVLGGAPSILVSATLAKPEEIPTVISDFKIRNNVGDDAIHIIDSTRQHISCTFVDSNGYLFSPHDRVNSIEELPVFINETLNEPLIKRGYSPEIVFNMSKNIDNLLPEELKFNTKFVHIGMLTHDSIRTYAKEILTYIVQENRNDIFEILRTNRIRKMENTGINTLLTSSSIHYESGKLLHVATPLNFNTHIENISRPLLDGSPRLSDIIDQYEQRIESSKKQLESFKKSKGTDKDELDTMRSELTKIIDEIKFSIDERFIINSPAHAQRFDNLSRLTQPIKSVFGNKDDVMLLDEIEGKLLLSRFGIYQPDSSNNAKMALFTRFKNVFKGILATSAIVYGTNISGLTNIDIDASFLRDSSKHTLYQLVGRGGRKGKSPTTPIVLFRDDTMLDIILDVTSVNIEAIQVEENYVRVLEKRA